MPRRFGSDGEVCPRKSLDKWGAGPYDGRKRSEDTPMKILIFDPVGGASGDMILGSLLHLGCPVATLTEVWDALNILDGPSARTLELDWKLVQGIRARDVRFSLPASPPPAGRRRGRASGPGSGPNLAADPTPNGRPCRPTPGDGLRIFASCRSEAAVHGVAADQVHFHEVGADRSSTSSGSPRRHLVSGGGRLATPVPVGQARRCRHGRRRRPRRRSPSKVAGPPRRSPENSPPRPSGRPGHSR